MTITHQMVIVKPRLLAVPVVEIEDKTGAIEATSLDSLQTNALIILKVC